MKSKKVLGEKGEAIAIDYLKDSGYNILQTNFRSKFGEIDIIAKNKYTLVFNHCTAGGKLELGVPKAFSCFQLSNAAIFREKSKISISST